MPKIPTFTATGGDTNIGITLTPKGSGAVKLDLLTFPQHCSAVSIAQQDETITIIVAYFYTVYYHIRLNGIEWMKPHNLQGEKEAPRIQALEI